MATGSPGTTHIHDPVAEISGFLASDIQAIEAILHEIIQSDSALIREVGDYICLTSGKKLRPMITLLMERAFGRAAQPPIHSAAAIEAIHIATLIHDDVIDKARLRRGRPSVNAHFGDDVAILMADYLYAAAFELALSHLNPEPLRLICQVTRKMCEGEVFQIERRGHWPSTEDYLHIISCKTAYLFSACGALGGLNADLSPARMTQVTAFGLHFGLAFQITDDALDYTATDDQWGKDRGMDLATGKQTLPLILTLNDASPEDRRQLTAILNNGRDIGVINQYLERYGALERSLSIAQDHGRQALAHLEGLEVADEKAYEYLAALAQYVAGRRY